MSTLGTVRHDRGAFDTLAELMASDPDGFLEEIAVEHGVSTLEVVKLLPERRRTIASGDHLQDVLNDITEWGDILFIVEAKDIISGMTAPLPKPFEADGYYHFFGTGFGGHLKQGACKHIALVDRTFQKRRAVSVQFFNADGEPIFKVFISRDDEGDLRADQLDRFDQLRASLV
ncbi:MAG: heme utilization cystosolic carrier protein HutX [Candidatus Phaeomarinobacter sp.]